MTKYPVNTFFTVTQGNVLSPLNVFIKSYKIMYTQSVTVHKSKKNNLIMDSWSLWFTCMVLTKWDCHQTDEN